jgi:hypothetical protein
MVLTVLIFSVPGIFAPLAIPVNSKKRSSRRGSESARSRSIPRRARLRVRRRFITTSVHVLRGPMSRYGRSRWDDTSREPPCPWNETVLALILVAAPLGCIA